MHEPLQTFLTPENTAGSSTGTRRLMHAQTGLELCLGLPKQGFYEQARVFVVRVQIDLEHFRATEELEPREAGLLVEATGELQAAEVLVDERRQRLARSHIRTALGHIKTYWRLAA